MTNLWVRHASNWILNTKKYMSNGVNRGFVIIMFSAPFSIVSGAGLALNFFSIGISIGLLILGLLVWGFGLRVILKENLKRLQEQNKIQVQDENIKKRAS